MELQRWPLGRPSRKALRSLEPSTLRTLHSTKEDPQEPRLTAMPSKRLEHLLGTLTALRQPPRCHPQSPRAMNTRSLARPPHAPRPAGGQSPLKGDLQAPARAPDQELLTHNLQHLLPLPDLPTAHRHHCAPPAVDLPLPEDQSLQRQETDTPTPNLLFPPNPLPLVADQPAAAHPVIDPQAADPPVANLPPHTKPPHHPPLDTLTPHPQHPSLVKTCHHRLRRRRSPLEQRPPVTPTPHQAPLLLPAAESPSPVNRPSLPGRGSTPRPHPRRDTPTPSHPSPPAPSRPFLRLQVPLKLGTAPPSAVKSPVRRATATPHPADHSPPLAPDPQNQ